ncbi:4a-hydroxytetrahydrobiopterin dehydratase [Salinibacterium sp. SYSU T00001]|uniref:VOC family protein n=1 Tax=Homoserinimonas sedimenticola TaxID=2986805 RepID=UPI0022369AE6|nr:VOC family protein [Salinibacterium sedimenticola]MCW4384715.1 4a-hydroxytetrahydrobiopterin dehydratase [Salinibacterium sedimenticola]
MAENPKMTLSPDETEARLADSVFVHLQGALRGSYRTADFASAAAVVARVAAIADELGHHPHVRLGWGRASFEISSHDVGGVTSRDLELAQRIDEAATELGAERVAAVVSLYELAIDADDAASIRPFWKAVLDYVDAPGADAEDGDLVDPRGLGPLVWFQQMEVARTDRNRIHLDVYVPAEHAEARLAATLEAGGTLVTDEFAPDWWVVADAEGNEACICTSAR